MYLYHYWLYVMMAKLDYNTEKNGGQLLKFSWQSYSVYGPTFVINSELPSNPSSHICNLNVYGDIPVLV